MIILVAPSLGFMLKTSVNVLHVSQGMEACICIGSMPRSGYKVYV